MAKEKGETSFYTLDWSIENFSCFNREIHGSVITSPESYTFGNNLGFELHPRDFSGTEEYLKVKIHIEGIGSLLGELSFIGPDGSLLCTQQVASRRNDRVITLPPGPKFREVVDQIKNKEGLHEDRLTVRYLERYHKNYTEYMHTTIDVFEVSFKMSRETLSHLDSKNEDVFWINYPQDELRRGELQLSASKGRTDSSKMIMKLGLFSFKKKVLVLARMSVVKSNEELVKTVEEEHLFVDDKKWIFSVALTNKGLKDFNASQIYLMLVLKIIPSKNYRQSLGLVQCPSVKVDILPSNSFMSSTANISASKTLKSVTSNNIDNSVGVLTKELMCLYKDHDFSDFQLKCGCVSFPVHKNILSARSPVFKTMLSTDMRESVSGSADVKDLDPSTLGLFLTYLYTSAVEELQGESALKLYYAADKYQVPSLKRECADFLRANVSILNVCDILSFANKYRDEQLIAVAHEFVLNNYNKVLASEQWKNFLKREPLLVAETVTYFAEKKYVSKRDAL